MAMVGQGGGGLLRELELARQTLEPFSAGPFGPARSRIPAEADNDLFGSFTGLKRNALLA
jgi:hypothetical protein